MPKPSARANTHGVGMTPMHWIGSSLCHRAMVGAIAPDTMVDTCVHKIIYSQEGFWGLVRFYVGYCRLTSMCINRF